MGQALSNIWAAIAVWFSSFTALGNAVNHVCLTAEDEALEFREDNARRRAAKVAEAVKAERAAKRKRK